MLSLEEIITIIYIAFGLNYIFEKRTKQITTYLSKILQVKLKTTLTFFEKPGPVFLETS